jgi:isopentenyldiphosphate isomerase
MEYLDIYDENQKYLGKEFRDVVHRDGLWHKTIHCWLYDKKGNVYFQIRKEEGTFYTTASGHVSAGETLKEAFGREIKEEIGLDIDYEHSKQIDMVVWKMDRKKSDGSLFIDRAFASIFVNEFEGDYNDFNFQEAEVKGVVKVNAKDTLELFKGNKKEINAEIFLFDGNKNKLIKKNVLLDDFLITSGETQLSKYGKVLEEIILLTNK